MAIETSGGLRLVGAAIDEALPAPKVARKQEGGQETAEPEFPLLPAGCPVKPLGKNGQVCYFLDEQGQLVSLDPQKIGKNHIRNLFGRRSELCDEYWPRIGDNGKPNGWKPEIAGDLLMRACAFAGIFDPQGRVRGRGAHRGKGGELILHCGDTVYYGSAKDPGYRDAGMIDGFVYPTATGIPRPDPGAPTASSAEHLLAMFRTWNWARPIEDPMFLLGLIVAMMAGGALRWRPHGWITGSKATGKSTLQQLLEMLFDGGALHTHDASEAALRQLLKQQTLPVFFDELEPEEGGGQREKGIIKLARLASSGAVVFRGGQDHQGHEFIVRSSFLFSSILVPPMLSQDRSRLAILELLDLPEGAAAPVLGEGELRQIGRDLRKRLVDQWHRFDETLDLYRRALGRHGHGGRSQDQFGTLLACADLVLYDFAPEANLLDFWGDKIAASKLAEKADDDADELEAVHFLRTTVLQGRGGVEPRPISNYNLSALEVEADKARDRLQWFGLKLVTPTTGKDGVTGCKDPGPGDPVYIAIANRNEALAKIFDKTRWSGGVWTQAFGRVGGAIKRVKVRFSGSSTWATLLPLGAIVDVDKPKES